MFTGLRHLLTLTVNKSILIKWALALTESQLDYSKVPKAGRRWCKESIKQDSESISEDKLKAAIAQYSNHYPHLSNIQIYHAIGVRHLARIQCSRVLLDNRPS